jgi:alkanesulfonate monooxygenase SsuD/methylene tetrahydromethanopterin reductase-like flavin-dependent oxidoreductase (luciferase family)
MFVRAGFSELVEAASSGLPTAQLVAPVATELLDHVGLVGSPGVVRRRVEEYRRAGADVVCIAPATSDDPIGERTLRTLATWAIA